MAPEKAIICKKCKMPSPYTPNGLCYICDPENINKPISQSERKICELSVTEFKKLWTECYEELERHKLDTKIKGITNINKGGKNEVFIRNGEAVPQEC